jgi:phosphoglycolate phosphatase-like HAD superfamily hydrolase
VYPGALILFDIDGTLLSRAGPHHRRALEEAVRRITGRETSLDDVPTHGKLDRDLLNLLLTEAGLSQRARRAALPESMRLAQEVYLKFSPPSLADRLCPGVSDLLDALALHHFKLAVVTGNLAAIGWRKLELAGIRHFFCLGAFSEQASTRALLARAVIRQARRERLIHATTPVVLIGDHANDVEAAHANRVHAIATGTGLGSTEELRAARPHLYVKDLTDLKISDLTTLFELPTTDRTR